MELKDRFGGQVEHRKWYLVPLNGIEETIEKIRAGTLADYYYDPWQCPNRPNETERLESA